MLVIVKIATLHNQKDKIASIDKDKVRTKRTKDKGGLLLWTIMKTRNLSKCKNKIRGHIGKNNYSNSQTCFSNPPIRVPNSRLHFCSFHFLTHADLSTIPFLSWW